MANLPGFVVDYDCDLVQSDNRLAVVLDELSEWVWPPVSGYDSVQGFDGTLLNTLIVEQEATETFSGEIVEGSFFFDWYDTIHIVPNTYDLGNLLSDQDRDFEVWNAYLSSQLLSTIGEDGTDGMDIDEPFVTPTTFSVLESRIYTLNVSVAGPSVIDATYTFNFPSDTVLVIVTGNRAVVWPFEPNWRRPVEEELEWLTDVIESDNGSEQGIKLRDTPRSRFSYLSTVKERDQRWLQTVLWSWQANLFALPIWTDEGGLTADAALGATSISVDTSHMSYQAGALVILMRDTTTYEAVEITTVNANSLELAQELNNSWGKNTRVYPGYFARMNDRHSITGFNSVLDEMSLEFSLDNTVSTTAAEFNGTSYLGFPVLEERPNWVDDRTHEFQRLTKLLDNKTGSIIVEDMAGLPITFNSFSWLKYGRESIYNLRKWLYSRTGRLNRIWIPTDKVDLVLVADVTSTDIVIKVENIRYYQYIKEDLGKRDICIHLRSGQRFYRRIVSSSKVTDDIEQLGIDSVLGQDVGVSEVYMISWIQLSRMASDTVQLLWHNTGVQECTHNLRSVLDDV